MYHSWGFNGGSDKLYKNALYIYIYVCTCIYIYVYIYIYVCMYIYMYIYMYMNMYIYKVDQQTCGSTQHNLSPFHRA